MATGRTLEMHTRVYMDGYDLSGYARKLGDLKWEYDAPTDAAWTDGVKNVIALGQASLGIGALNAFLDNTATSGLHIVAKGAGVKRTVMVARGIRAAPAQGDPVYCGEFEQGKYTGAVDGTSVVANVPFENASNVAANIAYSKPWGVLLAPLAARIAVNNTAGVDCGVVSTTAGGFLCYQITAWNGTGNITIKVQDADTNSDGSFGDVTGLTSGALAHTLGPTAGIIAIANTATIKQYTRWQIVLGGGLTGATFALALVRG